MSWHLDRRENSLMVTDPEQSVTIGPFNSEGTARTFIANGDADALAGIVKRTKETALLAAVEE